MHQAHRHDPYLALSWLDDPWAVGTNETSLTLFTHDLLDFDLQIKHQEAQRLCTSSAAKNNACKMRLPVASECRVKCILFLQHSMAYHVMLWNAFCDAYYQVQLLFDCF